MSKKSLNDQIKEMLEDGKPHLIDDLHSLCYPSSRGTVHSHVWRIRKQIEGEGKDILCVVRNRRLHYQMVRTL